MLLYLKLPRYYLQVCDCVDQPDTIVVDRTRQPSAVLDSSHAGVRPGVSEAEAFALAASAHFVAYEPERESAFLTQLLEQLEGESPDIEIVAPGEYLLDLGRTAHDKALSVAERLSQSLKGNVGLAYNRFVARLAALRSGVTLVPSGEEESFVAPYPVSVLPVDDEVVRRLDLLGLTRLEQLRSLPPRQLTKQFGALGKRVGELARGLDGTAVSGRPFVPTYSAIIEIEGEQIQGEQVQGLLQQSLEGLFSALKSDYKLASCVHLLFHLEGGERCPVAVRFASPVDDAQRALALAVRHLESTRFPEPIRTIHLQLDGLVSGYAQQLNLLPLTIDEQRRLGVERVVQRLKAKAHLGALMQVSWLDPSSRLPERRAFLQDLVHATHRLPLSLPKPARVATGTGGLPAFVGMRAGWIPVDWMVEAWELDEEWWTDHPVLRSYYRVLLRDGSMLRLFRDGRTGGWFRQ